MKTLEVKLLKTHTQGQGKQWFSTWHFRCAEQLHSIIILEGGLQHLTQQGSAGTPVRLSTRQEDRTNTQVFTYSTNWLPRLYWTCSSDVLLSTIFSFLK